MSEEPVGDGMSAVPVVGMPVENLPADSYVDNDPLPEGFVPKWFDENGKKLKLTLVDSPRTMKWAKMRKDCTDREYGCIYYIENTYNGKCYVGQSVNLPLRIQKYNGLYCKDQPRLYNALMKYGLGYFTIEVIDIGISHEQLDLLEILFIAKCRSQNDKYGYNIHEGGSSSRHTEESKKKIGDGNRGKVRSPEHCKHISEANKGKKRSEDVKQKARDNYPNTLGRPDVKEKREKAIRVKGRGLGRKASPEARANMSKAKKGKPLSEKNKKNIGLALKVSPAAIESRKRLHELHIGKKRSPETCKKIGEKSKGRKQTEEQKKATSERSKGNTYRRGTTQSQETKDRIRNSSLGRKDSPETVAKRVKANTGQKRSPESRARMSEAAKNRRKRERELKEQPPVQLELELT